MIHFLKTMLSTFSVFALSFYNVSVPMLISRQGYQIILVLYALGIYVFFHTIYGYMERNK